MNFYYNFYYIKKNKISNHFTLIRFFAVKGMIYHVAIATVNF